MPRAPFFRQELRSWNFVTCYSPVEVFLRAEGAFFLAKMTFLRFLGHVTCKSPVEVVLRAAGFFFRQEWRSWISVTCTSPVEDFSPGTGVFWGANSDTQMALAISVMGEES